MNEQHNLEPQPDLSAGDVSAETVNLVQGGARDVFARTATITQGGASQVKADNVVVRQGGVQRIEAANVTIRQAGVVQVKADAAQIVQSGVVLAQAEHLTLDGGTQVLGTFAGSATMDGSLAQVVVSRGPMEIEQSAAVAVLAPAVTVKNSVVGLLFAQRVEGNVSALFGPRAAVAFGAAFGAAFGVALALARISSRRRGKLSGRKTIDEGR